MERVQSEGRTWTSRTLKSAHSDVEVTLFTPASGWNFFIYLNSRGYILPLLVCFPFLCFPRGSQSALRCVHGTRWSMKLRYARRTISPFKAVPKHRELRQMVDAINDFLARVRESAERAGFHRGCRARAAPLAAMRINVEALQSWVISESQQELLGVIRSNSRAARLVNQLLLMMHSEARIDTEMEPVPLTTLFRSEWPSWNRWRLRAGLSWNSSPRMTSGSPASGNAWCR
jgi:hypothetical protein